MTFVIVAADIPGLHIGISGCIPADGHYAVGVVRNGQVLRQDQPGGGKFRGGFSQHLVASGAAQGDGVGFAHSQAPDGDGVTGENLGDVMLALS